MKILAFYLPQFHRTKENDEWWGEGYTEWTAVKKAKSLFPGHDQPRVPWKYYDLLEKRTMIEQTELMHQYGVDGMCFYHYYFENGKKILEKPAENLLQWRDVDMPFCFYWANESWARTWSNVKDTNIWVDTLNQNDTREGDGLLLKQAYGERDQWKEHFDYLFPFFEDSRYIKKDGRPIFIIYRPENISCLADMIEYWNSLMDEKGFPHIFFIGRNSYAGGVDGYLDHPVLQAYGNQNYENEYGIKQIRDYDYVWKDILSHQKIGDNYFHGGFVGYDDTPRRGKNGTVVIGQTPKKFKYYMICLLAKAYQEKCDMVFLNAWNEWGESMYLEPDTKFGTEYLQALKEAKEFVNEHGDILSFLVSSLQNDDVNREEQREQMVRYRGYWQVLSEWLHVNEDGGTITQPLNDYGIKKIAIYGMGMLGDLLYKELGNHNIEVVYGIDRDSTKNSKFDIPICSIDDDLQQVDLIIVTVDYAYGKIRAKLLEKGDFKIIALKELVEYVAQL